MNPNNIRDIKVEGSTFLEFRMKTRIDHYNNRERIAEFEAEMRRNGVDFVTRENRSTGAYSIEGKITNRMGMIYRKLINLFASLI